MVIFFSMLKSPQGCPEGKQIQNGMHSGVIRIGGRAGCWGSVTMCEERDLSWTCMAESLSGHCFSHGPVSS